ncbi:hypothetical protein BGX26_010955 [Mortierella sp. AD094]|nr:hypothetical protein BGX26_010955 [Mortierella sp. AD094]
MGILVPACMASDGTRIYAFAYGSKGGVGPTYYVLIKSNSIPSYTLNDMSWTLVSALGGAPDVLGPPPASIDSSCLVDETGVFTIVSDIFNFTRPVSSKGQTLGLQYQPAGNTSGGSGAWNCIYSPSGYFRSTLFYLKDFSGKNALMKTRIPPDTLFLSTLDPTTFTFTQETSLAMVTHKTSTGFFKEQSLLETRYT